MKVSKKMIALWVGCALASFVVTLAGPPASKSRDKSAEVLGISAQEWTHATATDASFAADSKMLTDDLEKNRAHLADLLNNPATTDDTILGQVERVINARNQLERRAAQHLLAVRRQLTAEQQKKLMGLASESVRKGGFRWRGGRGATSAPTTQENRTNTKHNGH